MDSFPSPNRASPGALLAVVACGAVGLLGLEAGARLDDWWRFGVSPQSQVTSADGLWQVDSLGGHGRPNASYQKWRMNALGLRGAEASLVPLPGRCRVITVGASETFGLYESPLGEWPAVLSSRLPARFEVLNAGLPGMSLPTVRQDIRLRLAAYRPAGIVLYPSPAQFLGERAPEAAPRRGGVGSESLPFRSVGRVRDAVKGMLPGFVLERLRARSVADARARAGGVLPPTVLSERLDRFDAELRAFVGDVRQIGAQPYLLVHAHAFLGRSDLTPSMLAWQRQVPLVEPADLLAFEAAAAERVIRVAADSGVPVVDPRPALHAPPLWADAVHFADAGADSLATAAARLVAARPPTGCGP